MRPMLALLFTLAGWLLFAPASRAACNTPPVLVQADAAAVAAWVRQQGKQVLTFSGYSGAGYEDEAAMLATAAKVLDAHDPAKVLVNAGGSAEGIGAVYGLARQRGFGTLGIVSTLARDEKVALSPCVDRVFFVPDSQWGGLMPGPGGAGSVLSPTSQAMVAASSQMVLIGGGDIARDEALAARAQGKPVRFYPADLNHASALSKAKRQGKPAPVDFRGAAHLALAPG